MHQALTSIDKFNLYLSLVLSTDAIRGMSGSLEGPTKIVIKN